VRSPPTLPLVMCDSREQAEAALTRLRQLLAELGLEPKEAKTRIVELVEGGGPESGFDFLGFHHRLVRARGRTGATRITFLARWPTRKATQHARDRIRDITARSRLRVPVEIIVRDINTFLRGWAGFFRYAKLRPRFRHDPGIHSGTARVIHG
jgi:RNA-directed DNA polymerase